MNIDKKCTHVKRNLQYWLLGKAFERIGEARVHKNDLFTISEQIKIMNN